MTIVIPFCHKDADQALRLIAWIVRLGGLPAGVKTVLAVSRRGSRDPIGKRAIDAGRAYLSAAVFVPHDEDERGWPHSATHLFQRALDHVPDDLFWLEPDCVPVGAGWFDALLAAWVSAGKAFLGAHVRPKDPSVRDHLTGCSFYGKAWRQVAPGLLSPVKGRQSGAWDLDYADQILPHAAFTDLIQHDWDRFNKGYKPRVADLSGATRLFHQCKTDELMCELDPGFLQWRLTQELLHLTVCNRMSRHFLSRNVSKQVLVNGRPVRFEPVTYFAASASFWGVREAADENEAAALTELAAKGVVAALSPEEYNVYLEKKNGTSVSHSSKPLSAPSPASGPAVIQTASVKPADAVKPPVEVLEAPKAESLSEALAPVEVPPQRESLSARKPARRK